MSPVAWRAAAAAQCGLARRGTLPAARSHPILHSAKSAVSTPIREAGAAPTRPVQREPFRGEAFGRMQARLDAGGNARGLSVLSTISMRLNLAGAWRCRKEMHWRAEGPLRPKCAGERRRGPRRAHEKRWARRAPFVLIKRPRHAQGKKRRRYEGRCASKPLLPCSDKAIRRFFVA